MGTTPTFNWIRKDPDMRKTAGFSLLELSVVLFIMLMILAFALPRFSSMMDSDLEKEAKKLATTIGKLRNRSILYHKSYQLVFDTKKSEYAVYQAPVNGVESNKFADIYPAPILLQSPVEIKSVTATNDDDPEYRFTGRKIEFDKIFGQTYKFRIDSSGFVDLFSVTLADGKNSLTVTVTNIMGKIAIGRSTPLNS